jgi:uncharacterized protein YjbJ (UPF0337 family)
MGTFEQVKGAVKEKLGDLTDNPMLSEEGEQQAAKGAEETKAEKERAKAQAHEKKSEYHEGKQEAAEI